MKKILLICTSSGSIVSFRKNLILKFQELGFNVAAIAFDGRRRADIEKLGVELHVINDDSRSINPFKLFCLIRRYKKIINKVQPDAVFTFMLKPNIYGSRAARKAGVKYIFSMVEGGGDVFGKSGIKWKIIRKYCCAGYKRGFNCSRKVFFTNNDDKAEFIKLNLVDSEKTEVVNGIGVDVEAFAYKPITDHKTFLMVARMLESKGVFDYCNAARIVKRKFPDAVFNYIGGEQTITVDDIKQYTDDGSINYLGITNNIKKFYEDCTVQVLPTYYREGLGLVNAEAGAVGRPTITCDVIGARDTVVDGYNGFFVKTKSPEDLAEKMIYFLENPNEADEMGRNNRKLVEEKFDQRKINKRITDIISKCMEECK